MTGKKNTGNLSTTALSLRILKLLADKDGVRVNELADHLDRPKSTVHGHLATLRGEEFVIKEGDQYVVGPELLRLGNYVRTRKEAYDLAAEYIDELFEETGLRSIFVDEMGGRGVFIHTSAGDRTKWRHERIGNRLYMHNTAVGKAMLAEMSRDEVEQIIDRWGLPAETERTVTSSAVLFEELERVDERGYAYNGGENFKDLHAIGVAATDADGDIIGAFSVTGPRGTFSEEASRVEIAEQLITLVDEFELELSLA